MKKLFLISLLILGACGVEDDSDIDIVGGQTVYRQFYGRVGGCGATLIAPKWAVSAAHCFNNNNPRSVTFGLYKRSDPFKNGGKDFDKIKVKNIYKHPDWVFDYDKNRWKGYDLAMIELERPSKFKPKRFLDITPKDGDRILAFGFGQTSHPGKAPEFLQGAVFNFNKRATDKSRKEIIRASAPGKAVCFGDSGGPVIYNGDLIATTTFTIDKCHPGTAMGFTKVDVNWMKELMR